MGWRARPDAMGTAWAVSAGHPLAAQAASQTLAAGGNAVDAGVAGGICLGVVHPDIVNFAGVAPTLVFDVAAREAVSVAGVGPWPRRATLEFFARECAGEIPEGILRTVVPGAPDAWITLLERHGTIGFAEAAAPAIRLAREGFPMGRFVAQTLAQYENAYRRWPSSAAIFLPGGRTPRVGERFVQDDWARTLTFLADEDLRARTDGGRAAGLAAVRHAFYRGDVAARIAAYHQQEGGLLTREDLASFHVEVERPSRTEFRGHQVLTGGFWGQGPVLLQMLNLMAPIDLARLRHNSAAYVHILVEAMKVAFADREAYYGDPHHVDVPAAALLDLAYADRRRTLVREAQAWPDLPPAGDPRRGLAVRSAGAAAAPTGGSNGVLGTSYIAVVDAAGNAFSCTPSDVSTDTPVIPGLGFPISSRGSQSWLDPAHPSVLAPGKRPRITQCPALVLRDNRPVLVLGTPGGDIQPQVILQVLLNLFLFEQSPQEAVELPRFETRSVPDSFWPHGYTPGLLRLEAPLARDAGSALQALGHGVEAIDDWHWQMGSACLIRIDAQGVRWAAADPRRDSYALAW